MSNERPPQKPAPIVTTVTPAPNARMVEVVDRFGHTSSRSIGGTVVAMVTHTEYDREYVHGSGGDQFVPRHRLFALVAQSDNERIAELENELVHASEIARSSLEDTKALRKTLELEEVTQKDLESVIRSLNADLTDAKARYQRSQDAVTASSQSLRKLEDDLAKVKRHFGEKAYAEAIGKEGSS